MRVLEEPHVSFEDALSTAETIFAAGWKQARIKKGVFSESDARRMMEYRVPSAHARKVFDVDLEVQRLLTARDERLPHYHEELGRLTAKYGGVEAAVVAFLADFPRDGFSWTATVGTQTLAFPTQAMFALVTSVVTS